MGVRRNIKTKIILKSVEASQVATQAFSLDSVGSHSGVEPRGSFADTDGVKTLVRWVLIALLLLLAIWSIDQAMHLPKQEKVARVQPTIEGTRDIVNRHLQLTNKQLEIAQGRVEQGNRFLAPRVGDRLADRPDFPRALGAPMNPDRAEHNAPHDLKRKRLLNFEEANPTVAGQIRDKNDQREYLQKYREEYVKLFLSNARRNGLEITLSPDLVVTGVRQVRPQIESNSDPSTSGAQ